MFGLLEVSKKEKIVLRKYRTKTNTLNACTAGKPIKLSSSLQNVKKSNNNNITWQRTVGN